MKDRIEEYTKHYYTGNHLSSTQLVTDGTGVAVQQVEYAPFGEVVNEYNIDWSSGQVPDFKFNGKELDEESGMYYFEARYHSPPTFISRDPLYEKYFWMSPYAYCGNNPINLMDADGRKWLTPKDKARADKLISQAQHKLKQNNKIIARTEAKIEKLQGKAGTEQKIQTYQNLLEGIVIHNDNLSEGIKNIQIMTNMDNETFYFDDFEESNVSHSFVQRETNTGYIAIHNDCDAAAWHEIKHIGDWLANPNDWLFDEIENCLSTYSSRKNQSEADAYRSEYAFNMSGTLFRKFKGLEINDIRDITAKWYSDYREMIRKVEERKKMAE
ncbi:MAG: RHS repeat-associated core domain-containing protein [Bacteroidales bacterium]|jgi:RHS repeat-associated protein|nr:RHS repeat-associated core domain-containing protein [Bacteroidales bacterium]